MHSAMARKHSDIRHDATAIEECMRLGARIARADNYSPEREKRQ